MTDTGMVKLADVLALLRKQEAGWLAGPRESKLDVAGELQWLQDAIRALPRSTASGDDETAKVADILETIEWQTMRWEAGSPELAAARVILSALRLRYGGPSPEEE